MSKRKTRRQRKNQQGLKTRSAQQIPALSRVRSRESIPTDLSYVVRDLKRITVLGLVLFASLGALSLFIN